MSVAKTQLAKAAAIRQAAANARQHTATKIGIVRSESDKQLGVAADSLQTQLDLLEKWQETIAGATESVNGETELLRVSLGVLSIPNSAIKSSREQLERMPANEPVCEEFVHSLSVYSEGLGQNNAKLHRQLDLCSNEVYRLEELGSKLETALAHKQDAADCNHHTQLITEADGSTSVAGKRSKLKLADWSAEVDLLGKQIVRAIGWASELQTVGEQTRSTCWEDMCAWHDEAAAALQAHIAQTRELAAELEQQTEELDGEIDALKLDLEEMAVATAAATEPAQVAVQRLANRQERPADEQTRDGAERALFDELRAHREVASQLQMSDGMLQMQAEQLASVKSSLSKDHQSKQQAYEVSRHIMGILNQATTQLAECGV